MKHKYFSWLLEALGPFVLAGFVAACSVSHPAMRGSVVAVVDNEAHICIGASDGLKVGDTLIVYRTRQVGRSPLPYGPIRTPAEIERSFRYEKTKIGKVRVTRLFDEHFAAVKLLAGEIDYPDIVEKSLTR